ncbi:MAG: inositol monophosphatase [Candidatus Omnitrophica bacterium]|nr:inositol monophosphatase [Candidatus Omnitrophota bacterium]
MVMEDLKKIKEVAEAAAREAGRYALSRMRGDKQISHKSGFNDLVTDVDRKCEKIVLDNIKEFFPGHSILAEESGREDRTENYTWIVDPIDGTTNFAHGFPVYCTSVGVYAGGKPAVAAVYDPNRDELFSAAGGEGAFLNGERMSVSRAKELKSSLFATGFAYNIDRKIKNLEYFKVMLAETQAVRRPGAAALDLCYVACGRLDGFWEMDLHPWDTAAGFLLVMEAGGRVTSITGEGYDIRSGSVLATNGLIHDEAVRILGGANV